MQLRRPRRIRFSPRHLGDPFTDNLFGRQFVYQQLARNRAIEQIVTSPGFEFDVRCKCRVACKNGRPPSGEMIPEGISQSRIQMSKVRSTSDPSAVWRVDHNQTGRFGSQSIYFVQLPRLEPDAAAHPNLICMRSRILNRLRVLVIADDDRDSSHTLTLADLRLPSQLMPYGLVMTPPPGSS